MCTWSKEDDLKLLKKIRPFIQKKDSINFSKRSTQINWERVNVLPGFIFNVLNVHGFLKFDEQVMFNNFSAEDCIKRWNFVINKQRQFKMLSEILHDAVLWVKRDGQPKLTSKVRPY